MRVNLFFSLEEKYQKPYFKKLNYPNRRRRHFRCPASCAVRTRGQPQSARKSLDELPDLEIVKLEQK